MAQYHDVWDCDERKVEARMSNLALGALNKRAYEAAKRFWSTPYIQHSAHIEPGREGLFNLIKISRPQSKTGAFTLHLVLGSKANAVIWVDVLTASH
jgi:predicted SnoaL-like aldol condensation-catalyzing enzyme